MNEKRRHPRFVIESMDINGRIMFARRVEILDISLGGVLLKTDKRLNLDSVYMLKIEIKGKTLTMAGKVVRAELTESTKDSLGQIIPIYSAGMQFLNVTNEQTEFIEDCLKERKLALQERDYYHPDKIQDRRLYVRFLFQTPEKATIECYDSYHVKNISKGGIRMESYYCLAIGEKHHMEIVLSEQKTIGFLGKVISCLQVQDKEIKQYDVGIEFDEIADKDKEVLKMLVDSL